jgi:hypothetical protein
MPPVFHGMEFALFFWRGKDMQTTAGIFDSPLDARRAVNNLQAAGFGDDQISLLFPGSTDEEVSSVPTEDAEQPGMGGAIGGVVGGAIGLAGGAQLGPLVASFLLPGIGPIVAIGFAAAAGGGLGALAGGLTGATMEKSLTRGLPKDELFFYEDALRQGKSVVVAISEDDTELERAREVLAREGAESLDAARDAWWIGLRSAEEAEYDGSTGFSAAEANYRRGFEAALHPAARGKTHDEAATYLRDSYPGVYTHKDFIAGYENGRAYYQKLNRL